jgi:hypothetical protein
VRGLSIIWIGSSFIASDQRVSRCASKGYALLNLDTEIYYRIDGIASFPFFVYLHRFDRAVSP